ncbi:hypothetical protein ACHWQZ_G017017 [Mnemiopsis leidyi]
MSSRGVVSVGFISFYLIVVLLVGGACCSLALFVLVNLVKDTSPGNGGKYRYWLQIVLKNSLTLLLDGLINLIVVLSPGGTWILSQPVCWITGYSHVTLVVMGISMICAIQFYQYLAVVVMPLEHPKFRHNVVLWSMSWGVPALLNVILPASTATDIQFSYTRMSCTFMRSGNNNHDTSLLVLVATSLGFTAVFCAILTLKVHSAQKEDKVLQRDARHISLFGDRLVKEKRKETSVIVSQENQAADLKLNSILAVTNILLIIPYACMLFVSSANSGSVSAGGEEFAILMLRLGPILDFGALCQDLIFRQRILDGIKSLDYICKCFYVRNVLCTGKVTPSATILVNPTE